MPVAHSTYELETLRQPEHPLEPLFTRSPRTFYRRFGKRALDIVVSAMALILLSPLFLLIVALIKLTSPGPVLYRQNRVGRNARIFALLKFRSMVTDAEKIGLGITISGDERVTRVGKYLREFKLDELPQLWNVFRSDMSLVGPRPELPSYVATYTFEQLGVLSVVPGITDTASVYYRHEEKLLQASSNPDDFYRRVVLPHKLALNLEYIDQMSLRGDLKLMLQTALSIVSSARSPEVTDSRTRAH